MATVKWSDVGKSNLLLALQLGRADRALNLWRNSLALHTMEFFKCLCDRGLWVGKYRLMDKVFSKWQLPSLNVQYIAVSLSCSQELTKQTKGFANTAWKQREYDGQ